MRRVTSLLPVLVLALAACGTHSADIQSSDPYEQYLWLIRLGKGASDKEIEQVTISASSQARMAREGAMRAVGHIGKQELAPLAFAHLGDPEPNVRTAAIEALGELQSEGAQPKIQEKLRVDSIAEVRRAAAKALRSFPANRSAAQDLVAALKDADGGVTVLAHETLQKISGQEIARGDTKGWQEWLAKAYPQ